ncbi:hypothetical protein FB451DRAFT_1448918 [Mycena latifolia]|nr:hypothetical protein FB451DRAFT_1448918 [Mycena latifolia]
MITKSIGHFFCPVSVRTCLFIPRDGHGQKKLFMLRLITDVHSNWTLGSPEEIDAVRTLSTLLESKISSYWDLGDAITLVNERAVMTAALRRVQELLSAFHLRIFEEFVMHRTELDPRRKALMLCRVSKRWRSVALSAPSLWRSLELIVRPGWSSSFDSTCISRSYPLPMDIHLRYQNYFPSALDAALRLISGNIRRIRYLCLDLQEPWNGGFYSRPAHIFPALMDCAPASELEFVDISISPNTVAWEWLSAVVGNAPKLTRFMFLGNIVPNPRWSQLESLSLGSIPLVEALRVLKSAPLLRNCDFILTSSQQQPPKPVLLHSLKCLMLQWDGTPGTDDVTLFSHASPSLPSSPLPSSGPAARGANAQSWVS